MISDNVKQHFRTDEIPFLNECEDLISKAQLEYSPVLTYFLNPRQQYLLTVMVNSDTNIKLSFNGGYLNSEMKRGLIYPEYYIPNEDDFKIDLIKVKYPIKFVSIHHSQILGTLLGTGIKRDVLGDILTDGKEWQFLIAKQMSSFVINNVNRIGRNKVELVKEHLDDIVVPINEWQNTFQTVSSMRLDIIIANGFNLSRHQSKELVQNEKVRLNWRTFTRPDYELDLHDVVSVRGFGRVMVNEIEGRSKRGKLKIKLSVLKK